MDYNSRISNAVERLVTEGPSESLSSELYHLLKELASITGRQAYPDLDYGTYQEVAHEVSADLTMSLIGKPRTDIYAWWQYVYWVTHRQIQNVLSKTKYSVESSMDELDEVVEYKIATYNTGYASLVVRDQFVSTSYKIKSLLNKYKIILGRSYYPFIYVVLEEVKTDKKSPLRLVLSYSMQQRVRLVVYEVKQLIGRIESDIRAL